MGISYQLHTKSSQYPNNWVIGIVIRKKTKVKGIITNPSTTLLQKELLTTHKKLKKKDKTVVTTYSIEPDTITNKTYHVHIQQYFTDYHNLLNIYSNYIGGSEWSNEIKEYRPIVNCYGKYGEVELYMIDEEIGHLGYINKHNSSLTLV